MHLKVCVHAYMHQPASILSIIIQMFTQTIPTVNWNGIATYYIYNHVRNYMYYIGCKKCNKGSVRGSYMAVVTLYFNSLHSTVFAELKM